MARGKRNNGFKSNKKPRKYQKQGYKTQITELQSQNKMLANKLAKTTDKEVRKSIQAQIKRNNSQIKTFLNADKKLESKRMASEAAVKNAAENTKRMNTAAVSTAASTAPSGVADVIDSTNTAKIASGRDGSSVKESDDKKISYEDLINGLGGSYE